MAASISSSVIKCWTVGTWESSEAVSYTHLEDRFYTEEEQNRFDDIDPIAIREALEERGIVNGQVADPEKLDNDPFIQQVMSDVEQIAAAETCLLYTSIENHG